MSVMFRTAARISLLLALASVLLSLVCYALSFANPDLWDSVGVLGGAALIGIFVFAGIGLLFWALSKLW